MNGAEGTGDHAKTAAPALRIVDQDQPVFQSRYRIGSTYGHADRIIAVKTYRKDEILMEFPAYRSRPNRRQGGPPGSWRQAVLLFTGGLARIASDAPVHVHQKGHPFHPSFLLTRQIWQRI
jgi:hypothetical protein